ncbi:MAG: tRNA pseudouridine(38-40) synthase TruA [Winogradskyella sp.]|nr:tRNA pseudouridine(38-40) synthase TruA [Winogradskyella sp.]MBT8376390.1 tRNA pseudouridine(38-40) synthase TruA [Bacteroidia bacterium]NNF86662.1 tRNA pseudouridine(38-40) synthase TruA [Winogradskyella sp.]NNK40075.1 tRNA pseudouridine(38-40) synthase TruA [Winogradskyella sp.]NNL82731.1 tRNA pseudouridine(38-40) synthase TruA [Winogradskyella sp.]
MFQKRFYYLIKIQYLGYRFHGWQKQPNLKTLHLMIDRTLKFILEGQSFKTLGAGRTDAMVSANEAALELFLKDKPIEDLTEFLKLFNHNLPQDIRALSIIEVDKDFNIIQNSKIKEYHYVFSEGQKNHPFCAPILTTILEPLDVELMKQGAKLFEGSHNFKTYCYRPTETGEFHRTVDTAEIIDNTLYLANFFPKESFIFRVRGKGFMRNQIRLMFGALIKLGRGEISLDYITNSLLDDSEETMDYIAPASGLILHAVEYD